MVFGLRALFFAAGLAALCAAAKGDRVDDYIRQEMKKRHIPGLQLAVIKDGKPVKMGYYGLANVEHNIRVKKETIFQIQSMTKSFVAAAVMMLVEEGKVGLDESVGRYLDGTPPSWSGVTIRHLLSHTSGIKDFINEPTANLRIDVTEEEVFRATVPRPLNFPTGERYAYSNTNYHLLGMVIHRLTGKSWPQFVDERICKPLGMTHTRVYDQYDVWPNRASGYFWRGGALRNGFYVAPSVLAYAGGGINSTVEDLAKWEAALDRSAREGRVSSRPGVDGAMAENGGVDGATPSMVNGPSVDGATVWDAGVDGANALQFGVDGAVVGNGGVDGATPSMVDGPSVDGATVWDASVDGATPSLLKAGSLEQAWTSAKLNNGRDAGYGFGWNVGANNGHRVVSHGGSHMTGFTSHMARYLDDRLTVIVLTNLNGANPSTIVQAVANMYEPGIRTARAMAPQPDPNEDRTGRIVGFLKDIAAGRERPAAAVPLLAANIDPDDRAQAAANLKRMRSFKFLEERDIRYLDERRNDVVVATMLAYRLATRSIPWHYRFWFSEDGMIADYSDRE